MRTPHMNANKVMLAFALLSLVVLRASSQATYSQPRINAAVNDSQLTVLRGNTYPLARPEFDRGPVAATLPMQHMLLVLKRSPAQEAALEAFMSEQLDPSSPEYHHWLTPAEFGQMYGPAQEDIDTITKWLQAHGFQVNNIANGRMTIDFSGNAAEVQEAFHTPNHQYVVKGQQHFANSSDPSIPTALVPVVAGVRSLHNFYPRPAVSVRRAASSTRRGNFTFNPNLPGETNACDIAGTSQYCFTVGPNDFATIYNVQQLWDNGIDGTGEAIAIVADSNIESISPNDVQQFRMLFGLSGGAFNVITPNGAVSVNGDEIESLLDAEWSGAVAKGATIDLVASPDGASAGIDLSADYVIQHNIAPILSSSYGDCEFDLGTTGNSFYNSEWQQAAAEGITVVVASGDAGAASCDLPIPDGPSGCGFSSNALLQAAQCGLAVNGLASTPYNVAVGGTDFNDLGQQVPTYWSTGNQANGLSAQKYIPEDVYNDTCTNAILFSLVSVNPPITTEAGSCSDLTIQDNDLVSVVGGGGGESNCTNGAATISACSGGNARPAWQVTAGTPGTTRDLPDVSLFAGDGFTGQFYVMCEADSNQQNGSACALGVSPVFTGVGGTSASVQAFAGIMALVDQKNGNPAPEQGNVSPVLYSLAANQSNTCIIGTSCTFNDVTMGTNSTPCAIGSKDCITTASLPVFPTSPLSPVAVRAIRIFCALGIGLLLLLGLRRRQPRWVAAAALCGTAALLLVSVGCGGSNSSSSQTGGDQGTPEGVLRGYSAGPGYDLATGLGSVNAYYLATTWGSAAVPVPPATIDRPTVTLPVAALAIICALCLGLLFVGFRRRQLRWTTAVLLLAFALSILSAARTSASTRPHHPASRAPAAMRLASFTRSHR